MKNEKTGKPHTWYVRGYFTSEEIIHDHWAKYGKPSEYIAGQTLYKRRIWNAWVKRHEKYFYPIATLPIAMHEALFEGMGAAAPTLFRGPLFIFTRPALFPRYFLIYFSYERVFERFPRTFSWNFG